MIMKMVTKFKVCTPKPDADLCIRVDLSLDKKKMWKIRTWPLGCGPAFSKTCVRMLNNLSYRFPSPDGKVLGQMSRGQVCWLALGVPESRLGVF